MQNLLYNQSIGNLQMNILDQCTRHILSGLVDKVSVSLSDGLRLESYFRQEFYIFCTICLLCIAHRSTEPILIKESIIKPMHIK